jgi:hypothetical protein
MRLTASSLPRAAVCPGSVVLPQADVPTEHSEDGSDSHEILETAVARNRLEDLPDEIRALIPMGAIAAAEVAVAYDLATDKARVLGLGIRRAYSVGPTEIAGTIDLQIVVDGERATVVDYKRWEDVGAPDENEQTLFYGLVTARLFKLAEVRLVVAYVGKNDHGEVVLNRPLVTAVVDELDLAAFVQRLRWIALRVKEQTGRAVPDVRVSKQCKWCNAKADCPATTGLIKRVMHETQIQAPLTEETASQLWEWRIRARSFLANLERALYAFAKDRPFRLSNGNIVGEHPTVGNETLNGDIVHEVVAEKYGKEVADKAVIYTATKKRLEAALKEAGVPSPTKAKESLLVEIRRRGGAHTKRSRDVEEYKPTLRLVETTTTDREDG